MHLSLSVSQICVSGRILVMAIERLGFLAAFPNSLLPSRPRQGYSNAMMY